MDTANRIIFLTVKQTKLGKKIFLTYIPKIWASILIEIKLNPFHTFK